MAKTPVVLVTCFRSKGSKNRPLRAIAFDAVTRQPIARFYKRGPRAYYSASAAIRRSGTHEEVYAFWGTGWLRDWSVREEIARQAQIHGSAS